MRKSLTSKILVTVFLAVILSACAGGREFVRPSNESFVLGSTTHNDVIKNYGEPRGTQTLTRNGIPLKSITYSYAVAIPFSTRLSTRAMVFVFDKEALVSYDYASSFDEDKNSEKYEAEKVNQIAKGDKKSKVLAVLGKPGGEAIYPVVSTKGGSLLRYTYLDSYRIPFSPTPRITRKVVTVLFDENDSVVDVSSVESKPE